MPQQIGIFTVLFKFDSDEEKAGNSSRDALDQSCELAREQLLNSIRQQWRKLRNHVEKLDQGTSVATQSNASFPLGG